MRIAAVCEAPPRPSAGELDPGVESKLSLGLDLLRALSSAHALHFKPPSVHLPARRWPFSQGDAHSNAGNRQCHDHQAQNPASSMSDEYAATSNVGSGLSFFLHRAIFVDHFHLLQCQPWIHDLSLILPIAPQGVDQVENLCIREVIIRKSCCRGSRQRRKIIRY